MACSKFDLKKPCNNCPFRREGGVRLTIDRAYEVAETEGTFTCHKTTVDTEDGDRVDGPNAQMCAGFMLYREKTTGPNQMMRIAGRLGMYDPSNLDTSLEDDIIDDPEEMAG